MTERQKTALSIFRRLDAGNVPAPWVPPELPASNAAPGRAVAKVDRTTSPPAPWVPAELPASTAAAAVKTDDRKIGNLTPWVPPELPPASDAPRNLPAKVSDDLPAVADDEPRKRKKNGKRRKGEL